MTAIVLEFNMPPSTNTLFSWKVRRYKSDSYKQWILSSKQQLNNLWIKYRITWNEWLEVHINCFFSLYTKEWKKRIKDIANYEKAVIDFIADHIEWFQDHKIKIMRLEKHDSDKNIIKILIKELENIN